MALVKPDLDLSYATLGLSALLAFVGLWQKEFLAAGALTAIFGLIVLGIQSARAMVHLRYDLDDAGQEAYAGVVAQLEGMSKCRRLWQVGDVTSTNDWKRNAGAGQLVSRYAAMLSLETPKYLHVNVPIYCLSVPSIKERLYFTPDRMLLMRPGQAYSVPYHKASIAGGSTTFIEAEPPAEDATVLYTRWRYIRRDGGPDLRFADNRQLPVCKYGTFTVGARPIAVLQYHSSAESVTKGSVHAFQLIREISEAAGVKGAAI